MIYNLGEILSIYIKGVYFNKPFIANFSWALSLAGVDSNQASFLCATYKKTKAKLLWF